jgi:hypothetical protein
MDIQKNHLLVHIAYNLKMHYMSKGKNKKIWTFKVVHFNAFVWYCYTTNPNKH